MKKDFYDKLARPFETDEKKKKRLILVNNFITYAVYIVYPVLLAVLFVRQDSRFLDVFVVPFVTFVAVTLFRRACNAPRPYEVWHCTPLIPKKTKGKSFPSRHVFSVYIIAMAAIYAGMPQAASETADGALLSVANGTLLGAATADGTLLSVADGVLLGMPYGILIGVVLMIVGVFLAAVRVIARVHFLKDVIVGAALGIGLGWLGFFVLI